MYKVKLDGYVLYHADHPSAMLTDPVLELEPGYAGVFTATVPPDNPLYDRICCRKSMVSVFRNNREIFYGEVRKVPNIDRYRNKQIAASTTGYEGPYTVGVTVDGDDYLLQKGENRLAELLVGDSDLALNFSGRGSLCVYFRRRVI